LKMQDILGLGLGNRAFSFSEPRRSHFQRQLCPATETSVLTSLHL
jgi:hypothetical protein